MSECTAFERHFENLIAGELDDRGRDELALHVAECADCCEIYDFHGRLADVELDEPRPEDLAAMRAAVLSRLDRGARAAGVVPFPARRPGASLRLAAVAATVVLGVGVGGFLAGQRGASRPLEASLLADLDEIAASNHSFADAERSPYLYSNVRLRPGADGSVELSFEVSTHVEVRRPVHDPLVKEVLVQSLMDRTSVGARLDALDLAPGVMDPKVRQALVHTLLRDPDQAVRLRASTVLAEQPASPELVAAFVGVLGNDESVQMRLLAVDYLGASGMSPEALRDRILESEPESVLPALMLRASQSFDS